MKVYVSELPKRCLECGFCCKDDLGYWCQGREDVEGVFIADEMCIKTRLQSCPLQSLADYTKQVRKEVLDQVYKVFTTEDVWSELKSWWLANGTCEELKNCLDAMIEETLVENIVKKFGRHKTFYQMLDLEKGETECQKN